MRAFWEAGVEKRGGFFAWWLWNSDEFGLEAVVQDRRMKKMEKNFGWTEKQVAER